MNKKTCQLPGGYVDASGGVHRDVTLSPLSGHEEELLADSGKGSSAYLVTAVLNRCIHSIGTISPLSEEVARNLLVADRQYLLLKLREVTFGEHIQTTILCPWPDCGKRVDIDFSINEIPIKESVGKGPTYEMELSQEAALSYDHGERYRKIIFRLPNGRDQEAVSPLLSGNEAAALTLLLKRCILGVGPVENAGKKLIDGLSPLARMEIEKQMEAVAPGVELNMGAFCPECGREFALPFDLQDFFFGELRTSRDLLFREVHYLAYHYNWGEREIMEMPREKRRKYIEVLADEIERMNNATV